VGHVVDQVVTKLLETSKKKNKGGMDLKPMHVKSHMWVFVNCLIENPSFDSQTKENMTLKAKNFGSSCSLSDKFVKSVRGRGYLDGGKYFCDVFDPSLLGGVKGGVFLKGERSLSYLG